MTELGTMAELPADYLSALAGDNLLPLWPVLRGLLPRGRPERRTSPTLWRYAAIRPLLLEAGRLTPIEKAERRVLVLVNPGLGEQAIRATSTIYAGMQLILPGETAPNHRHTPSAVRFVVEGTGGFTAVDGEKCPMEKGDLILTPAKLWHEHGHGGPGPVIWLDALDLPMVYDFEASYAIEGPPQRIGNEADSSQTRYRRAGLVPYRALNRQRADYPLLRFPWREVRASLEAFAGACNAGEPVQLAYVNPETGMECLPTLGFSALMLRPGEELTLQRRSASALFHVIEGEGTAEIDGVTLGFAEADSMAVPTHAAVALANRSSNKPAFLFVIDDAPMQRKLGFYEEFDA
ncbi:cupin domain-containing protein [Oleomonas cavernae]|uniref:Cupin domain-containing protein n=1 Tax=Oleomonas cavernae TaxID=2320859 RepID=A0A418W8M8_9PROT|nr:cupin domain-containing protein [Oleomonas cavernae]RJF86352.1 cupin domain-containing protein [Oleomonas cavernae]